MLSNDWRSVVRTFTLGLVFLAFFVVVLFTGFFIGRSAGFWDAEANGYSAQYQEATKQRVSRCFSQGKIPSATARCTEEAITSAHENERAEHNLQAQRQASDWQWWLLVVSIVQTPVTLVGILLLLRNIQQADAANKINREIGIAQVRAYLSVRAEKSAPWSEDRGLEVTFMVSNSGNSPAREVHIYLTAVITKGQEQERAYHGIARLGDMHSGVGPLPAVFRWKELKRAHLELFADGIHNLRYYVTARYKTVFKDELGEDNFKFLTFVGMNPARFTKLTVEEVGMVMAHVR